MDGRARWRGGWRLLERDGDPEELVRVAPETGGARLAVLTRPARAALVLGSAQRASDVGNDAPLAVVRRRSGGGAVLVRPGGQVWLDVFVPAADPLAERDVGRAAWWLGELWAVALRDAGVPGVLEVHRGGLVSSPHARQVCFAGLGPGEVTLDGRKAVGLSQRRERAGTWLFTMAPVDFEPKGLLDALVLATDEHDALDASLRAGVARLAGPVERLESALRAQLS